MNFLKLQVMFVFWVLKATLISKTKANKSTLLQTWRALNSAFSNTAIHICKIYQALMKDAASISWLAARTQYLRCEIRLYWD